MTQFAAADAAAARFGVEGVVDPATEAAVAPDDILRVRADTAEIVVRRVDLDGERASVEATLAGEHRETANAAAAEPVKVGFAVAIEDLIGAGAGVEENLVALKDAVRMQPRPVLERKPGVAASVVPIRRSS